jgi:hypothetical protein
MSSVAYNELYDHIPKDDPLELYSNGNLDYQKLMGIVEFDKSDLSKVADISKASVRFDNRIPKELETVFNEMYIVITHVGKYFDGDPKKTALWFKAKNPMLGDISPRDMIRLGRYQKLMKFILSSTKAPKVNATQKKTKAN